MTHFTSISPAFANLTTARFTGHTAIQWNPVTKDTVGTCHSVRIIRVSVHESGHLEKKNSRIRDELMSRLKQNF